MRQEELGEFFRLSLFVINSERPRSEALPTPVESYLASSLLTKNPASSVQGGDTKLDLGLLLGAGPAGHAHLGLGELRAFGDQALLTCGFFPESLALSSRGRSFYKFVGEVAYLRAASLCGSEDRVSDQLKNDMARVFRFLGASFTSAAKVLEDLADLSALVGGRLRTCAAQEQVTAQDQGLGRAQRLRRHYEALVSQSPRWRVGGDLGDSAELAAIREENRRKIWL